MKEIFTNLALFIVFCIVFSGLTGCADKANSQKGPVDEKPQPSVNAPVNTEAPKKTSVYPPLAASIANADLELLDGTITKVADRKGKVILLNLWGIWCGPCRYEMPHLVEMQEVYKDQGFQIIGLNIGDDDGEPENVDKIKAFAEKMKLNYELARISRETTGAFYRYTDFTAIPQSLLIDRDGNLRGVFTGAGPRAIKAMKETIGKVVTGMDAEVTDVPANVGVPPTKGDNSSSVVTNKSVSIGNK